MPLSNLVDRDAWAWCCRRIIYAYERYLMVVIVWMLIVGGLCLWMMDATTERGGRR